MRYLLNELNGRVLIWTPTLHKRSDMRTISEKEAEAIMAEPRVAVASADADAEAEGDANDKPALEDIMRIRGKLYLEEIGRKHGIELDRRRTLKTLQAELIEHLGLAEDE